MNTLNSLLRKDWIKDALELDELIKRLTDIRQAIGSRPCKVIGVFDPEDPTEAEVAGVQLRSDLLDYQAGQHLNSLAGSATEIDVEDSVADAEFMAAQGEIVYLVLGEARNVAPNECYER